MIYRLHIHDWRVIAHYLGILIMLVAMAMVFCFVVALALGEYKTAVDFLLSIGISATVGAALILFRYEHGSLDWRQSLIITGLCWVILSLFGALPLSMSGQYANYLDAMFDTVSAFTTTGMSLALDTDHMALSLALWRAIMHLIGGIGVVVIALALGIFGTGSAAASLYRAEARSGQVMPEIRQTSRFILRLAAVIVVVGTIACMIPLFLNGFSVRSALVNGFIVTASAFSTGGMSTHSMGLMYYHSWPLEVIALVLAMLGCINFVLYGDLWRGRTKNFFKDIEVRTLVVWVTALVVLIALAIKGSYFDDLGAMLRRTLFETLSGAFNLGFSTMYTGQILYGMGSGALFVDHLVDDYLWVVFVGVRWHQGVSRWDCRAVDCADDSRGARSRPGTSAHVLLPAGQEARDPGARVFVDDHLAALCGHVRGGRHCGRCVRLQCAARDFRFCERGVEHGPFSGSGVGWHAARARGHVHARDVARSSRVRRHFRDDC